MVSIPDEPNVRFGVRAQRFLDRQNPIVQGELIALATQLYFDPYVDGESKTLQPFLSGHSGMTLRRVYQDDDFLVVYDLEEGMHPRLLVILDIMPASNP